MEKPEDFMLEKLYEPLEMEKMGESMETKVDTEDGIHNLRNEYIQKYYKEPTHILIPISRVQDLCDICSGLPTKIMGMRVVLTADAFAIGCMIEGANE